MIKCDRFSTLFKTAFHGKSHHVFVYLPSRSHFTYFHDYFSAMFTHLALAVFYYVHETGQGDSIPYVYLTTKWFRHLVAKLSEKVENHGDIIKFGKLQQGTTLFRIELPRRVCDPNVWDEVPLSTATPVASNF